MGRIVLGVLLGAAAAGLIAWVGNNVGLYVYPPPPGFDMNPELAKAMVGRIPVGALLWALAAWAFGAFVGGLTAVRVSQLDAPWPAWAVGGLSAACALLAATQEPRPLWFVVMSVLVAAGASYGAGRLAAQMSGRAHA